jgi:hypothetical protein
MAGKKEQCHALRLGDVLMVTAVVAVLLRKANGALLLALLKVSPIIYAVPGMIHADFRSDGQQMGDAVPAVAGAQVTMHCKSCMSALLKPT